MALFNNAFTNQTVLVTGHTGFKGSWLTAWLRQLGANVVGYSLPDLPTIPSNFAAMQLERYITDVRGDIRDYEKLRQVIVQHQPTIIFHLAAQPIVLHAVRQPKESFDANSGGTVNLLEAVRTTNSARAVVAITTDKVYRNQEWLWGYRESDTLGGHDPYSASKAMAELAITAYRETYFPAQRYPEHGVAIASARAGNVIGGGDFADYRLVPDCMKSLMAGQPIEVRNPHSVRPWQHVLEPLSGYLWLAAKLLQDGPAYAEAWNFGPLEQKGITTQAVAEKLIGLWGNGRWHHTNPEELPKIETGLLRLSWDKAAARLNWRPVYRWEEALAEIVTWFQAWQQNEDMYRICRSHIEAYVEQARDLKLDWSL
jgi:CDP-glucose 4,6-dehydratase